MEVNITYLVDNGGIDCEKVKIRGNRERLRYKGIDY